MTVSRRPGTYVLLGVLAFTGACGDDPSGFEQLVSELRECGIVSEGKIGSPDGVLPEDNCWFECLSDESCAALDELWCGDGNPTDRLEDCVDACAEEHGIDCGDGTFVSHHAECDGYEDCDDGTDERGCESEGFACGSGETVPESYQCDGEADCDDESDEMDCGGSTMFDCGDETSVPASYRCDFEEDCNNGSDEEGCAKLLCD